MKSEVRIPEIGESVTEAVIAQWYRRDGEIVREGDILFLIETDKVTLEVVAETSGVLHVLVMEGATVPVGTVVATIEQEIPARSLEIDTEKRAEPESTAGEREPVSMAMRVAPSARELAQKEGVDLQKLVGTGPGGQITRGDVLLFLESSMPVKDAKIPAARETSGVVPIPVVAGSASLGDTEPVLRKPMSRIRQRIAERLLQARQNTAMLTTFNEVDMSNVQGIRSRYKEAFKVKYGVSLGIMSFFVKASIAALRDFPAVNAFIDGHDVVYHNYYHIGIAIGAERGLVVPVIRHAERMNFADIEKAILEYVAKVKDNRLELSDLEGGTFSISNGGVYGSLLSTPILNPPQSGILGLHKIQDRPVVIDGSISIRPMMYVALTYDHRIIDGREAVLFLRRIKKCLEQPETLMLEI